MTRVLVVTEEPILAEGFRAILRPAGYEMVDSQPDVAIVHLAAPDQFNTAVALHTSLPLCKIVLWGDKFSGEVVATALDAGVRGILSNTMSAEATVTAISAICKGDLQFHFPIHGERPSPYRRVRLTGRERELLTLICQGLKNKEIASMMHTTEGTVKVYLNRLFKRLGVKDRFELALYGMQQEEQVHVKPAEFSGCTLTDGLGARDYTTYHQRQ